MCNEKRARDRAGLIVINNGRLQKRLPRITKYIYKKEIDRVKELHSNMPHFIKGL